MSWVNKLGGGPSNYATAGGTKKSILDDAPSLPGMETTTTTTTMSTSASSSNNNNNTQTSAAAASKAQQQQKNQQKQVQNAWANNNNKLFGDRNNQSSQDQPPQTASAAAKNSTSPATKNNNNNNNNSANNDDDDANTKNPPPTSTTSTTATTTPQQTTNNNKNAFPVDFYVVLDFEATCDRDVRLKNQEIIEFPSVLVDANRCCVVSEFQRFVRPIHTPKLSKFCTDLTGIPQEVVDEAQTFPSVWEQYFNWLGACGISQPEAAARVAWVTCGDWDLKTMLPQQLRNPRSVDDGDDPKLINKVPKTPPQIFQRWVNLKTVVSDLTKTRIRGMDHMADVVGVKCLGHHHSGIDDCRNIARILIALLRKQTRVPLTWGNFSPEELALSKAAIESKSLKYPPVTSLPAQDLAQLSPKAQEALEKAQTESKIQQQLEEAAAGGRTNANTNNNNAAPAGAVASQQQQQDPNRRKRGMPIQDANESQPKNNAAAAAAAVSQTNSAGAGTLLGPVIDVDTSRDAARELLTAAGVKDMADTATIQSIAFPSGQQSEMTQISKRLSSALRHNALEWRIPMSLNGLVKVSDLLRNNRFHQVNNLQLAAICSLSDKQRFSIFFGATQKTSNDLFIRANQGHSIQDLVVDMERITDAKKQAPLAIHGTTSSAWEKIRTTGLSRMTRQHIHFASGLPGSDGVISGMRTTSDVLIYLDVAKVLADGIPVFKSSNGVILSPGDEKTGMLDKKYFEKVVYRQSGKTLDF